MLIEERAGELVGAIPDEMESGGADEEGGEEQQGGGEPGGAGDRCHFRVRIFVR